LGTSYAQLLCINHFSINNKFFLFWLMQSK